ncbi:unnamed protein product [Aphis gossypii]|uniref:Nuclease HARBI1 n=1 Tax=Aphis gossypii TaxID=80765 RepID=A0A9P0J5M5_APHGO|nr:unnamed protein product [Aphis gossypii]
MNTILKICRNHEKKVFRNRMDGLEMWDDDEFFMRFRLKNHSSHNHMVILCVNLNFKACLLNKIVLPSVRQHVRVVKALEWINVGGGNCAILPITKLLLKLRFYALGTILLAAGDFVGVSKTSAYNIVRTVTEAIASLRPLYIKILDHHCSIQETRLKFYNIARFPRIISAIDCTHVKLQSPDSRDTVKLVAM